MVSRMPRWMGINCAVKLNSALLQAGGSQHFRYVPVIQYLISGEILGYFAKTGFKRRLSARAADAAFRVANDAMLAAGSPRHPVKA